MAYTGKSKFAIDWSTKPMPWSWIGPSFKREVEKICNVKEPAKPIGGFKDIEDANKD